MPKEKLEIGSQKPVAAKVYELLITWQGQTPAAWGFLVQPAESREGWEALPIMGTSTLSPGSRLRAATAEGQAVLEAMLAHGYAKEVE